MQIVLASRDRFLIGNCKYVGTKLFKSLVLLIPARVLDIVGAKPLAENCLSFSQAGSSSIAARLATARRAARASYKGVA